jgi:hypothetical protein
MSKFGNILNDLYVNDLPLQAVANHNDESFLETMENALLQRQTSNKRLGKNNKVGNIGSTMKSKEKGQETVDKCTGGIKFSPTELEEKKKLFCKGYQHVDLSTTEIKNIAIHYLKNDIKYNDKEFLSLSRKIRLEVKDKSCKSKLFDAKDVSLQQVAMDTLGKEKEWVAVVNLNTKSENGYLQSELPRCESEKHYLIGAKVEVKAYVDNDDCCLGEVNYQKCIDDCEDKLKPLKDKRHKHFSKDVLVTGTTYEVKDLHIPDLGRRRRLLQVGKASGC